MVMNGWPTAKVGQHGIWCLEVPVNFVGYRHGHFNFRKMADLKRVEAVIAAEKDPMKALRSKSLADRVAGAYFWWSINGRKDAAGARKATPASKETTDLVLDAIEAALDASGPANINESTVARELMHHLGLPTAEIFKGRVGRNEQAARLRAWRKKNADFRLTEYSAPEEAE
jgi:hypothetical protein